MCLAIPGRVVRIHGDTAIVDLDGTEREASLTLLEDVALGDYVIVHAGFALHRVDEAEALASLAVLRELVAFASKAPFEPV